MNTQSYTEESIEFLEGLIESKQAEVVEIQYEIDNYEEDYVGELIHEKVAIQKEIDELNKILDKRNHCVRSLYCNS